MTEMKTETEQPNKQQQWKRQVVLALAIEEVKKQKPDEQKIVKYSDLDEELIQLAMERPRLFFQKYSGDHALRVLYRNRFAETILGCRPPDIYDVPYVEVHKLESKFKGVTENFKSHLGSHFLSELVHGLVRLILLFGTAARATNWLRKTTDFSKYQKPGVVEAILEEKDGEKKLTNLYAAIIHDGSMFTLPSAANGTFLTNVPRRHIKGKWGDLFLQAPSLIRYSSQIFTIEDRTNQVPETLLKLREEIKLLPSSAIFKASLGTRSMGEDLEAKYVKLIEKGPKTFVGIPAPGGKKGIRGENHYHLRQLDHDDPMQAAAGFVTDCCQHLGGAASSVAKAAYREGNAAIWGVFKRNTMVAQAFVWRSKSGKDIVLDSVEALDGHTDAVAPLFIMAAKSVLGVLGTKIVYCGTSSGISSSVCKLSQYSDLGRFEAPKSAFKLGYSDASQVIALAAVNPKKIGKVSKKDKEPNAPHVEDEDGDPVRREMAVETEIYGGVF